VFAVERLRLDVEDLVEALKYGLLFAPELRGFDYIVVDGMEESS